MSLLIILCGQKLQDTPDRFAIITRLIVGKRLKLTIILMYSRANSCQAYNKNMDGEHTPDPSAPLPPKQPDDLEAAPEETRDYTDITPPEYQSAPRKKRKWPKLIIGLILLGALGGTGYWFFLRPESKQATTQTPAADTTNKTEKESTELERYISNQFTVSFDHPADWEITDAENSGRLTLNSPATRLKDSSGQTVTGQIIITMRDKKQLLPEFDKGNAIAAKESEKITYAKPSAVQRARTYLSFLHLASSTTTDTTIDALFITGDAGYQTGQAIPRADILPMEPVISVSFFKCSDKFCVSPEPLGISATNWDDKTFANLIKNILTSLVFS